MDFTYENFIKLKNKLKQKNKKIKTLEKSLIEVYSLFDFDKGAYLSIDKMKKLCGNIYIIERAKGQNVVRSVN